MNFKLKANFSTIAGPTEVIFSHDEIKGSDLESIYNSLVAQRPSGVIGGTYRLPQYPGLVELNLIAE